MRVGNYELPRAHLSASALDTFLKCPKQYEYRYVEGMRKPSNKTLALGSITHASFEAYYRDVLDNADSGERLSGKQVSELAMDVTLPDWFENNEHDVSVEERAEIEGTVPAIVERYVDNVGSAITPVAAEREVQATLRCGVPFLAYIDLIKQKTNADGGHVLVDYKISGRAWQLSRLQTSLQFMFYTYVTETPDVQVQNIVAPRPGRAPVINGTYAAQDSAATGSYEFTAGSAMHVLGHNFGSSNGAYLEELVERAAAVITAGIFVPSGPGNWWCSEKWCDYWPICRGAH